MQQHSEQDLDRLFADCRRAIPEIEPSPEFLAGVWRRVEESPRNSWTEMLLWAPRVAALGALAAALLTAFVWIPAEQQRQQALLDNSYLEALTVDSLDEHDGALWMMAGDRLASKR